MISTLGIRISEGFRRTAPDPFVLAVLLTLVTLVLVVARTETGLGDAINIWAGPSGVWTAGILTFAMQMCLILVTGHALASSPPVSRGLDALAGLPRSPRQAVMLVAFVAATLAVLNWGLGLIAGALLARRVGSGLERRGVPVHYPLLVAAGYVGLLVWHGGFSGSAPLKVTDEAQIADIFPDGAPFESIPLTETVISPLNLLVTGGLLLLVPAVLALMCPKSESDVRPASEFITDESPIDSAPAGETKPLLPRILEDSPLVTAVLVMLIGWWAWGYYFPGGGASSGITRLNPNTVNMTVLMLGLVLHGTPLRYVRAIEEAAKGCAGIILQFPLYAGIMGLMSVSGLTAQLAQQIGDNSTATTLPLFTLASAGLINLFVPSGGGQWAIQGPIAMQAAVDAGVSPAKMVMAVAYGDQLTNMLQPFWALPLLAITGAKARDIVGYTAIVMVFAAVWMSVGLLLL